MTIHEHLESINACVDARNWAKQFKTAREVYDNNTTISWLFWWSAKLGNISGIRKATKEIANSVSDLKNTHSAEAAPDAVASEAAYIAYAAYVTDDAAAAAAAAATAYATDVVVTAAKYAAYDAAAYAAAAAAYAAADDATYAAYDATYDAAYDKQVKLNMQIAKKHCPLPWSEASDAVASERR